jgi:hypothetical protein
MSTPAARFPVAVMMTRKVISRSGWSRPSWQAVSVLSGSQFVEGGRSQTLVRDVDGVQHFLFRGFVVELFRDAVETYWWNLTGERPSLFVICLREEGDELVPNMVTPDHEVAQAAVERDAEAFAVPIPPEIHAELERVVMEHYRPEPPRKRKQHKLMKEKDQ